MSSAKGSRLVTGDKKSIVRILIISLSALAIISVALFAYQQFTKPTMPDLESKDEAIRIALKAGNWNEQTIKNKKIEAALLHIQANGFSFKVDENTLQDTLVFGGKFPEYEKYKYMWEIRIIAPNNNDWVYRINAETGDILLQPPYQ